MNLLPFEGTLPKLGASVFLAPSSWLIGDVRVGSEVSIFFGAVLRGDIEAVLVGDGSNIQENSVLHTSDGHPCIVGNNVTIGHSVILHSCTIEDESLIGMGSTVLDGAVIGKGSLIGANSLISKHAKIPSGSVVYGSPAKVIRPLRDEERAWLKESARRYRELGRKYQLAFAKYTGNQS